MTGLTTSIPSTCEAVASLDPMLIDAEDQAITAPILSNLELNLEIAAKRLAVTAQKAKQSCFCTGLTLASLARLHMVEAKAATRTALLSTPAITRADALASLELLARGEGSSGFSSRSARLHQRRQHSRALDVQTTDLLALTGSFLCAYGVWRAAYLLDFSNQHAHESDT